MNYMVFQTNKDFCLVNGIEELKKKYKVDSFDNHYTFNKGYFLHINTVSENELKIREEHVKNNLQKEVKDGIYLEQFPDMNSIYSIFYREDNLDVILKFLDEHFCVEQYVKKEKYTKFNEIPQFTRTGNWEADFGLENLVKFIQEEIDEQGLQLNPEFQRGHVWTEEQQIAFLEYFLRGGKSGRVIYLNNPSWNFTVKEGEYNEYVCVDGLQRITAIQRFINNEIKVFDSYYNEYTDNLRNKFSIKVNINDLQTEKDVLRWYIEMNSGGTPHTKAEIQRVKNMLEGE